MSRNEIKVYKGLENKPFTPDLLESNPTMIDKDAVKAIKAISKAQDKTNASAYSIAYNLNELNKKRPGGAFVKKMHYKNISEFAERFFNIAGATALAYAQTAEQLLTSDEHGIHSPFAFIDENGKVKSDFTVAQLMEMRNTPIDVMTDLVDLGCFEYGNTTKAIRYKSGIVKALTTKPKEGKKNPYYLENATAEDVAQVIYSAVALLYENKDLTPVKALEMLQAPTDSTPDSTPNSTPDSTPDSTPSDSTPDSTPTLDTSDGTIYGTLMTAVTPFVEYASENMDIAVMKSILHQLSAIGDSIQVQLEEMTE